MKVLFLAVGWKMWYHMEKEAIQSGYYKSHGEGEQIEGFHTMYLIYTDSACNFYAWKELDNSVLFLCAELEDMELELADLIATVEIDAE